jgi:hypothetical protein
MTAVSSIDAITLSEALQKYQEVYLTSRNLAREVMNKELQANAL